jgi:hypothetical protein
MNKEEFGLLQDIEEEAILSIEQCSGYECLEYDNGTFECDNCPFYKRMCSLQMKADAMIKGD